MLAGWRYVTNSMGLLILRVGASAYLITHGWGKLQMLLDGQFEQFGDPIGIGSTASLIGIVLAEFVCPLLIIIGFATRFAAIPTVFAMGVAAFVAHAADPWTMGGAYELFASGATPFPKSKEPALLYMIPFLALIFTGAGAISVDGFVCWVFGCGRPRTVQAQAAA